MSLQLILMQNLQNFFWKAISQWKARDSDNTVVAVSHALHEVKDFDYCYVFADGCIVQQGNPREIFKPCLMPPFRKKLRVN